MTHHLLIIGKKTYQCAVYYMYLVVPFFLYICLHVSKFTRQLITSHLLSVPETVLSSRTE